MTITQDFLVEIGTEELPPKTLFRLATSFAEGIESELRAANVPFEDIEFYATPRRLAVLVKKVAREQEQRLLEKIGPVISIAYDKEGRPTAAAIGFAKSCQVSVESLQTIETSKGICLYHKQISPGESVLLIAPSIVKKALSQLPIPKPMLWGNHSTAFLRPVHWLVVMYGEEIVACDFFDLNADNKTFGHRFHAPQAISISKPADYQSLLEEEGFVIASYQKRREIIQSEIKQLAKSKGHVIIDQELLEEVTSLVEWPNALLGSFDNRFLEVPQEALISSMQTHQKCFPIVNEKGNLLPYFITIANISSKDPQEVIIGNERVIAARLSDAEFFYHADLKQGIERSLNQLKAIIFQNKLGSLYDKAMRISKLSGFLARECGCDSTKAGRAGLLAKADLASEMVTEFPELQGIMGYYYALENDEPFEVALAIKEHYLPRFSGDRIPTEKIGCLVALSDKIDTLIGIFGINQAPTGEKDPFGLRRAALGINRILIEKKLAFDLRPVLETAVKGYPKLENPNVVEETLHFIMDRLRTGYLEKGIDADVFASVFARYPTSPLDFDERIKAIQFFQQLPEAKALSSANKRVANILKQTALPPHLNFNPNLLELEAEQKLGAIIEHEAKIIEELCEHYRYQEALSLLAGLRQPIDKFFDEVMVMTDDEKLRNNRLILLNNLRHLFLQIADISLLQ